MILFEKKVSVSPFERVEKRSRGVQAANMPLRPLLEKVAEKPFL
jgi:hypothetical protein